ncbi:MAG TPA: [FeFe] hydrogenase H-cluster radical SAM maturase HydG [Bacteroidales bacterium]|nr:[FeFe] hydrogenase H-cluster radical SAM maturase HydG [Bacteroidales bacterium]HOL97696.1 [FeFe] hydrogenase H-cluster radical SAM maturase HydG [Bacteroidales bacterium]HOM37423.1 [FeFe] hydrogenase H-cluster radical SAM maturase HydG [Bacteroidales bacterium]HPD24928.1 [FeFe] hydrogenase H-cluster radical SAM maturase HydG [Bacteroidales bacterium]HRT00652.1 [FeFe] hydrogenase H-cluster radical SAM maturase HydG [Bacteroidales bacterium]
MIFNPEKCRIKDERMKPFIDIEEIEDHLATTKNPDKQEVLDIIQKSLNKNRLSLRETAILINAEDTELIEAIKDGARQLKEKVYGNRIVLFAPLYIGNKCKNNCLYCGFRSSNKAAIRNTLTDEEIIKEIEALEDNGQKRLILVYGEHDSYNPEYIAHTVRLAYSVKKGRGEIRRVNINAAPLTIEGFRTVKKAGIGTYQIFQETYHKPTYEEYHLGGPKKDYDYRLTSLDRAQEAGLDDVGIGALFGLYDWKFEVMALIRHTNHLEACYNVGPHTISFPRIKKASGLSIDNKYLVSDSEFTRIIAILRLAVPYTGLILTARENAEVRDEVIRFGVSQIDGGTKLELGSYSKSKNEEQDLNKEQFAINDTRSLGEIIDELIDKEFLPSFCTACYRLGRTGEHFMEFSVPGFIKRFCTPNAILTLAEYLTDYATPELSEKGWNLVEKELQKLNEPKLEKQIREKLEKIKNGERDLYF